MKYYIVFFNMSVRNMHYTVSCEAHHSSIALPGSAWASTEGRWSIICCCSWPRLHLWNLRPGSKCCQKIGHRGTRAREYPSFPSSCWDEMFWWEVHMELKGFFRAQFRSAVNHCRDGKAGTWCSWLHAVQSTEKMHACLPASAQLTYALLLSPRTQAQRTVLLQWAESLLMDFLMKTSTCGNVHTTRVFLIF